MRKIYNQLAAITVLATLISCGGGDTVNPDPVQVDFRSASIDIPETKTAESILMEFNSTANFDGEIEVQITEYNARYGENYITQPSASNNTIFVPFSAGTNQINIAIAPIIDSDDLIDSLALTIITGNNVIAGSNERIKIYLTESNGNTGGGGSNGGEGSCSGENYQTGSVECSAGFTSNNLDVVTWNIENFPMTSSTVTAVVNIIRDLDADIYALQEINEISAFNTVVGSLNEYEGVTADVNGSIELGFIYKTSEITSISSPELLFEGQTSPFPREPVMVDITHTNGLAVTLINLHLKCCDNGIARRANASALLKSYLDDNLPNEEVIVLGDWNEDLVNGSNSFSNFLDDPDHYIFADLPINQGPSEDFSYQLFNPRSHLDHLLITDELCDNLINSYTAKLDECVTRYFAEVSDHRPVTISLRPD